LTLHDVLGIGGAHRLLLPVTQERLVPLAEEIVLLYEMLETSNVSGKMSKGAVTKVSSKTIEARLQAPVPTASNLRMRLIGSGGKELPELPGTLYGKVVGAAPGTATVLTIRLTRYRRRSRRSCQV
jgi:hypothetical protein